MTEETTSEKEDFASAAKNVKEENIVTEFFGFLKENRKMWMAPIVILLVLFGLLTLLAATGAAPWVYTLF